METVRKVSVIRNDEKLSNCTDISWETVRKVSEFEMMRNCLIVPTCHGRRFGK